MTGITESDRVGVLARDLRWLVMTGARPPLVLERAELASRIPGDGYAVLGALTAAIEGIVDDILLPRWHPTALPAWLVRRILHLLLATEDGRVQRRPAPPAVRRRTANDLYFDTVHVEIDDQSWCSDGPEGFELALMTVLAREVVRQHPREPLGPARPGRTPLSDPVSEALGRMHRVRRPPYGV